MNDAIESPGELRNDSSIAPTTRSGAAAPTPSRALRNGAITVRELIDLYMAAYAGRDGSRPQRLAWWQARLGDIRLCELNDDHIHFALEELATQRGRYWAGIDAYDKPIYRAKRKPFAPATINRYAAALGA